MQEGMSNVIKMVSAAMGAGAGYLFGGWGILINILLIFVVVDWVTGWAAAWIKHELRSRVGFEGIARKAAIFLVITISHFVDIIVTGGTGLIQDAVIFFYLANELLSITENLGRMGVPMPDVLRNAVKIFESKSEVPTNPNLSDPPQDDTTNQKPAV
ncbi:MULTISPECIES: phage holin family protein [unclassified Paenibacillus]|uniref:phage holin family protein n=2 Tax=Paenibacillus TaxID=44249 RepID=UPI0009A77016|nr:MULTISPECIES: phage holin family protein [unclassified Paenibacillus]SLJ98062.1 toxin secretion/phage lysis holin [Paenibacillus sp. RU5A]SOC66827.1 toxin secretion/phage lysis holin [Paenibacillus sp. RU26A]SOC70024.1 toxin secretion/phage lysis holin [Paenibacillus sp. RU5M]